MDDNNAQKAANTPEPAQPNNLDTPKKSKTGMVVTVIIFILVFIAAIAGTYYYMNKRAADQKKQQDAQVQELKDKISELERQTSSSTTPQTADPTSSWKLLQSSPGKYSIKYPPEWVTSNCGNTITNFIAETTALLAICNTDKMSQITVQSQSGDSRNGPNGNLTDVQYFTFEEKPVEVNGVTGIRRVSVVKSGTDYQHPAGSKFIYYIFFTGGRTYLLNNYQYTGNQAGSLKYPDITSTFDTMVQKTLQFQ